MTDIYTLSVHFANISTIVLCIVLKVPQIISLLSSKSATGLSLPGTLLELTSFTIGLCYSISNGYALSSYLEYPFLVIQDILLVALVLHYNKQLGSTWFAAFGAYSAIVYAFTTGVFPRTVIVTLMSLCTPISAASKLAQLKTMYASQNSQSVSILTWSIAAYTCITRIFTTLDRGFDGPLMLIYSVSLVLNTAIILLALKLRQPFSQEKKTK